VGRDVDILRERHDENVRREKERKRHRETEREEEKKRRGE
jgi:hypothetical protein